MIVEIYHTTYLIIKSDTYNLKWMMCLIIYYMYIYYKHNDALIKRKIQSMSFLMLL